MINDNDFNSARESLIKAGSDSARACHPAHTKGKGSPDHHGQSLLAEARDEFRKTDAGKNNLFSGVTLAHYDAIHAAARKMGVQNW